ncbi:MAG: membrane protein insertase YidC [Alphaproteobacteria bacterium]|nr:membrane protein insertase YidC [Alphaproteobacteria bacterium]
MDQRNVILAVVISLLILLGFQYFVELPRQKELAQNQQNTNLANPPVDQAKLSNQNVSSQSPSTPTFKTRTEALATSPRIKIISSKVEGSISLQGGRIDDLSLLHYREQPSVTSPNIVLLNPVGLENSYFIDWGWLADGQIKVPTQDTLWRTTDQELRPNHPVTLTWDNGQGLVFERIYKLDENYLFTIEQKVENKGNNLVNLYPFGKIIRYGTPHTSGYYILHEGLLGVFDGSLKEMTYKDLRKKGTFTTTTQGGWLGITDKYWLTALLPAQNQKYKPTFTYGQKNNSPSAQDEYFQADFVGDLTPLNPGAEINTTLNLFAGAKEVKLLDSYRDQMSMPLFDRAVDFGWFYFLTKPIFYLMDTIYDFVGNFGISILLLTVIIKLLLFPLANKSYRAMSKMKNLAPEIARLKERYGQDRQKLNQEMINLYKREKANPASGCLPILIQIPVFFALYKVLFVTIEMRHAPFFGWIVDLSSPDPTSILNLFGLLPWAVPTTGFLAALNIGIWPLIMGITMYFQQKLSPTPPDPIQAKVFMMLPIVFTFMLAHFPAGLVIYWAWNNFLSISQQQLIINLGKRETKKA